MGRILDLFLFLKPIGLLQPSSHICECTATCLQALPSLKDTQVQAESPVRILTLPLPGSYTRPGMRPSLQLAPLQRKRLVRPKASRCRPHTVLRKCQEKRPQERGLNAPEHSQGLYRSPAAVATGLSGHTWPVCPPSSLSRKQLLQQAPTLGKLASLTRAHLFCRVRVLPLYFYVQV